MVHNLALPRRRPLVVLAFLALLFLFFLKPIHAAGVVGNGTPESCTGNALMAAIEDGGTVTFNCGPNPHTIMVNTSVINQATVVDGGNLITLNGQGTLQIFLISANTDFTVRNIILTNGNFGNGGAIYNSGTTTVDRVQLLGNQAQGGSSGGGAIFNEGTLTVRQSLFAKNSTSGMGGAIMNNGGTVSITDTTFDVNFASVGAGMMNDGGIVTVERTLFSGNGATTNGGGIYMDSGALNLTNVTFSRNAANIGGGLYSMGLSTIVNSTFFGNRADTAGGLLNGGETHLKNTIVAGSQNRAGTDTSLNCDGPSVISEGYNLIGDGTCVAEGSPNNLRLTDPQLGPLQDNGGPTLTHLPQTGSPAINAGAPNDCPATDQRGFTRPVGGRCDIGATEVGATAPRTLYLPFVRRGN